MPKEPSPDPSSNNLRKLILRTLVGILVLFGAVAAGAYFLKDTLTEAGTWFVESYGMVGIFVGTIFCDAFGVPVPVDTYLAAAVTSRAPTLPVLAAASAASILSGALAYWLGIHIQRLPILRTLAEKYRPQGERLFQRWGITAVTIAAWSPLPFSVVCWMAGSFRMPFRSFFLATLHRVPRIVLYYYIIALGWLAGAG